SIIQKSACQTGPSGPRAILGPLRFGNHDCFPVAQFFPIPDTPTFVLVAIDWIIAGQEVTVKYDRDGYYQDGCLCYSCTGSHP
ncbi:hypothetical protein PENSPDRAFT_550510, partial [Peniophora sp. CONT]